MKTYALTLAGMMIPSTAARADGNRSWKLLTQHYDGTSSIARYLTQHDCEFVRDRLMGNRPYDIEPAHLDNEVKAAKCFQ